MIDKTSRDLLLSSTDTDCQSFYFNRSSRGKVYEASGQEEYFCYLCHKLLIRRVAGKNITG